MGGKCGFGVHEINYSPLLHHIMLHSKVEDVIFKLEKNFICGKWSTGHTIETHCAFPYIVRIIYISYV